MKELLLSLSRYPYTDGNRGNLINLLGEVKDWEKTTELINNHGITSLAAYNIKEAKLEKEIPTGVLLFLENGQRKNIMRNIWLKERWKEVDEIFRNAGIEYILLKGMALEFTLYGSEGLRQMNDTDILVRQENSIKAWNLLKSYGFTETNLKSPLFKKLIFKLGHHLPALDKEGYAVEIHTHLGSSNTTDGLSTDKLFRLSIKTEIDNKKVLILPDEIHLPYLKSHFERHAKSGECQMRSFADLINLGDAGNTEFPDRIVTKPFQGTDPEFRKAAYNLTIRTLPVRYRMLFVIGDMFPSIYWMRERYKCSAIKAFTFYPKRIGKLLWLFS